MHKLRIWSAYGLTTRLVPLLSTVAVACWAATTARAANPIQIDNSLPGTPGWYTAFRPRTSVDAGVLIVERRREALLPAVAHEAFGDLVQSLFTGTLARVLNARQWAALYGVHRPGNGSDRAWLRTDHVITNPRRVRGGWDELFAIRPSEHEALAGGGVWYVVVEAESGGSSSTSGRPAG